MASAPDARRAKSLSDLGMVWRFARRYPGHIAGAAIALLVAAAATSGVPYAFKLIIDRGFSGGGDIARWFQYLLFLVLVMALATAVRFYFVSWLGERVVADIRLAVHRNLLRLAPGFFEENRPAEITSRITVDTTIIEQVVGTTISVALRNLVMGIACAVILFVLAPKLAAMMLLGIPLVVIPLTILGRRVRAISKQQPGPHRRCRHGHRRGAGRDEDRPGLQPAGPRGRALHQRHRNRVQHRQAAHRPARADDRPSIISLIFSSITWVIWQGAVDVAAGRMTGGTIAAFVLYGGLLAGAFGALSEVYGDLLRAAGASERLNELLTRRAGNQGAGQSRSPCPSRPRAGSSSRTSPSIIRPARTRRRSTASASRFGPRSGSRWSARRARARPPSSSSPSASTTPRRAAFCSTAST